MDSKKVDLPIRSDSMTMTRTSQCVESKTLSTGNFVSEQIHEEQQSKIWALKDIFINNVCAYSKCLAQILCSIIIIVIYMYIFIKALSFIAMYQWHIYSLPGCPG